MLRFDITASNSISKIQFFDLDDFLFTKFIFNGKDSKYEIPFRS